VFTPAWPVLARAYWQYSLAGKSENPVAQFIPEPWLRGPLEGVHSVVMPVFFTFVQVREELAKHTEGLTREQVWRNIHGAASLGFHIKHIAGQCRSIDDLSLRKPAE
jgi:hypothetical protein